MRSASGGGAGFTLLEVLAAVAVLGLLYTVLAGIAMQGLRAEGESSRRLEASLKIDQMLTEIEAGLEEGLVPPIGREEREEDDFVVVMEVNAFELPLERAALPETLPKKSLVRGTGGTNSSPLRRIDLSFSWVEGIAEREVTRTTFALDVEAAASTLEELAAQAEAAEGQQARPDEDDDEEEPE